VVHIKLTDAVELQGESVRAHMAEQGGFQAPDHALTTCSASFLVCREYDAWEKDVQAQSKNATLSAALEVSSIQRPNSWIVGKNEAACAADATREVVERWLPDG
jgi:hypothetical protein